MDVVYPAGSRQWWLQMEQSLTKLAGTCRPRSLQGRAFRYAASLCARSAVRARPAEPKRSWP